jgi:hypothetical protein
MPSFADHEVLFDDDTVREALKRELLEEPMPPVAGRIPVIMTKEGPHRLNLAKVEVSPEVVRPGGAAKLTVTVDVEGVIAPGQLGVTAELKGRGRTVPIKLQEVDAGGPAPQFRFVGDIVAPPQEEIWQIKVTLAGVGSLNSYLVATQK